MIPYLQCLALSLEWRIWCATQYLALNRGDKDRAAECYDMANKSLRRLELITMEFHV